MSAFAGRGAGTSAAKAEDESRQKCRG